MQPHEKLTARYDLNVISGIAIRQVEARQLVDTLDTLFADNTKIEEVMPTPVERLCHDAYDLVAGQSEYSSTFSISAPYDNFEYNGLVFESRLIKSACREPSGRLIEAGYLAKRIYILALIPEGQTGISLDHVRFGVVTNGLGQHSLFGITSCLDDSGQVKASLSELQPTDESLVVGELKKAVASAT